jgi:hypothetical protein
MVIFRSVDVNETKLQKGCRAARRLALRHQYSNALPKGAALMSKNRRRFRMVRNPVQVVHHIVYTVGVTIASDPLLFFQFIMKMSENGGGFFSISEQK